MSVFFRGKKLPAATITSLVLGGGCAASTPYGGTPDGGPPVTPPDDPASLAEEMCLAYQHCDPDYFSYYYDSLAQCTRQFTSELEYFFDMAESYYGAECADAYLDLWACLVEEMEDCGYVSYACEHLYGALYDRCDWYDYY